VVEYKRETRRVIRRFLRYEISFPQCIAELDAALADFIPRVTGKELPDLRAFLLSNNEAVMAEIGKAGIWQVGLVPPLAHRVNVLLMGCQDNPH
jgi:hypothetical protein